MSHKQPFDPEKALAQYTELARLISVGTYSERDHEGNDAEDSIEEAHDKLEYQAALRGLQFVRVEQNPVRYELHPMEPEQIEAFIDALLLLQLELCDRIQKGEEQPTSDEKGIEP